jgi:hypothetical protein
MLRELQAEPGRHLSLNGNHVGFDVRISVAIHAEWRRILSALAFPEYMDLWLTMPGVEGMECRPEPQPPGGFRIDVNLFGAAPRTIYGSCLRTKPDEISYLWERARLGATAKSVVKMRLRSGPRKCSLHLLHCGLGGRQEHEWYSAMWRESLDKLRGVMERRLSRPEYRSI